MGAVGSFRSRGVFAVFLALSLASCATTINDSAPTTSAANGSSGDESSTSSHDTRTSVDKSLTSKDLLTIMLKQIDELSVAMQKSDRKSATKSLEQIDLLTKIVRPRLSNLSEQLVTDFDRVVALAKSSVERNRPADADKALRFLPLIIDSLKNF
ncbi:MAG: hypothetical protein FJW19_05040 [Actinobacteria bacterium]|nr:hypothetical protein [Actinomycetota bacterium]